MTVQISQITISNKTTSSHQSSCKCKIFPWNERHRQLLDQNWLYYPSLRQAAYDGIFEMSFTYINFDAFKVVLPTPLSKYPHSEESAEADRISHSQQLKRQHAMKQEVALNATECVTPRWTCSSDWNTFTNRYCSFCSCIERECLYHLTRLYYQLVQPFLIFFYI